MKPYTGKVLWVDLSNGTFSEENIPDSIYQKYLAGIGLGAVLLYREIPPTADPLGPENILGFMSGLLTGSGSLFTGRWMAVGKSPLTGGWGDANCGGTFAFAIKQCGYDGILFRGISPKPVYLLIDSHGPKLQDAGELWGKDAVETETAIQAAHPTGKQPAVACIGQAGENLSLISGIVNDKGRIAARSGLGAVMGSKHLKAVALAGARRVGARQPARMRKLSHKCSRDILLPLNIINSKTIGLFGGLVGSLPVGMSQSGFLLGGILAKWGSVGTLPASAGMGDAPFKNWEGTPRDMPQVYEAIDPDRIIAREKRKYHCRACPLGCGGIIELAGAESHKPEYETTAGFSTMLLNEDLELVYELNELLNRAGMDSISASATIAYAMECYEKGWISQTDTGGIALTWGNGPAIRAVLQQMIERQGFGAWLADGTRRAVEHFGPHTAAVAMQAGGQEVAYHDPRLDPGMALHSSVDPTPGRHTTGAQLYYDMYRLWTRIPELPKSGQFYRKASRYEPGNGRTESAVAVSNFTQFYGSAGLCYMGILIGVDRVPIFEWANAATGWNLAPRDYLRIGQRIQTLRQMFNIRHGIDPRQVAISPRLLGQPPQSVGPNKGVQYSLEPLRAAYWLEIGWDAQTGIPTPQTLAALEMDDVLHAQAVREEK